MSIQLNGSIREHVGGSSAKKLRKENKLPAVIYGENGQNNINIEVNLKDFEKEYNKGCVETKVFEIKTEDNKKETFEVICYQIDLDPITDRPRHVDFISIKDKKEVKVIVPIKYTNRDKAIGLKNGGYVNVLLRKIQLICDPKDIPNYIEIDCSNLRLKQSVKLFDLQLPNNTKLVSKKNLMLVRVIGRGKDTVDNTEATTTATPTTATPAATNNTNKK